MSALLSLALAAGLAAAEGAPAPAAGTDRATGSAPAADTAAPVPAPAAGTDRATGSAPAAATAAPVPAPAAALAPGLDPGRIGLAAGMGLPVHLAASIGVLGFACSGEVIGASCGRSIEGSGGALAATYLLLATLPPLASGSVVWALGDDDAAPASLPWTLAGGAAGQLAGFGLALATDSPAVALLSLTAFPVAGEMLGLILSRAPAQAVARQSSAPPAFPPGARAPAASGATLLLPVASLRFE